MTSTSGTAGKRAPPPQLIFDDGSRVMTEESNSATISSSLANPSSIRGLVAQEVYYEIDRVSEEIVSKFTRKPDTQISNQLLRVALQFPDELLDDSPEVCWLLEAQLVDRVPENVTPFVFCLGDTTVGSCCPDEVAALHLQADVLVHYGHACLSPTGTLPVIYSFGRLEFDVTKALNIMAEKEILASKKMIVLYEVGYHHAMEDLRTTLTDAGVTEVVIGEIAQPARKHSDRVLTTACCDHDGTQDDGCCRVKMEITQLPTHDKSATTPHDIVVKQPLMVGGFDLSESISSWDQLSDFTVLFIGESETTSKRQFVNMMLRFLSLSTPPLAYWTYSPKSLELSSSTPITIQKQLNRRFYLTQKARDANVFGILVSNLSQQHLVDVVKALKSRIHDAGKSSYSFAVGKINPAKLANFAEIECFVLVACREHSLLDEEREYPVPVITPLELDVALGNLEWGSQAYTLDCQDVLEQGHTKVDRATGDDQDEEDEDAPYFSLVSGKYVQKASAVTEPTELDLESMPGKGQVTTYKSEAANFLKHREYQGLNPLAGQTEAKAASIGQMGIASNYNGI